MKRQTLLRVYALAAIALVALGAVVARAQNNQQDDQSKGNAHPGSAVGLPMEPGLSPGSPAQSPAGSGAASTGTAAQQQLGIGGAAALMRTPVSNLFPGDVPMKSGVQSPVGDQAAAAQRGMRYFVSFNCVGCHAPNGGGGMGPALSNSMFIYGSEPANIFLSIYQGRPRGMPSWGSMLPDTAIWDLVAYIQNISKEPTKEWGRTFSADTLKVEQVPAEFANTATPWTRTESFSGGQSPNSAK